MKNADIIRDIAGQANVTQSVVVAVLDAQAFAVKLALLGDDSEITIAGIGKLSVVTVPARRGRNPQTGEAIDIPAGFRIKFKAAAVLRDAVNRPIVA